MTKGVAPDTEESFLNTQVMRGPLSWECSTANVYTDLSVTAEQLFPSDKLCRVLFLWAAFYLGV